MSDPRLAARLPSTELVKRIMEHAAGDAEMALRWGFMHGQWEARSELLGVENPVTWAEPSVGTMMRRD